MDTCENSFANINSDTLEEVEAVEVIFEGQVTSVIDNQEVNVTFADKRLLITFTITENYPDESPQIKVSHSSTGAVDYITKALEKCAQENRGTPMLYSLISKALELLPADDVDVPPDEREKLQCAYFLKGNCKFGDKCFNLHGEVSGNDVDDVDDVDASVIKADCEVTSTIQVATTTPHTKESEKKKPIKTATDEDVVISEKKKPMKTAMDVIHRIMWDDSFPTENFIVGYLDRFLGIQEKPFTAFSWEDIASVDDYDVLAIPKHRIQYFKYKSVVVWDKTKRLDKVFGSTGDGATILDIINEESIAEWVDDTKLYYVNVDE